MISPFDMCRVKFNPPRNDEWGRAIVHIYNRDIGEPAGFIYAIPRGSWRVRLFTNWNPIPSDRFPELEEAKRYAARRLGLEQ